MAEIWEDDLGYGQGGSRRNKRKRGSSAPRNKETEGLDERRILVSALTCFFSDIECALRNKLAICSKQEPGLFAEDDRRADDQGNPVPAKFRRIRTRKVSKDFSMNCNSSHADA